jgi:hypothetical protein
MLGFARLTQNAIGSPVKRSSLLLFLGDDLGIPDSGALNVRKAASTHSAPRNTKTRPTEV